MRAIGARRRQVALVYLQTTTAARSARRARGHRARDRCSRACSPATSARCSGRSTSAFGVDPVVLLSALLVGLFAPPLAALPAIRRGVRVDLREALESTGSAVGGQDAADRAAAARRLPAADDADRTAQRRTAQAAQPRDGADRRARGRQPARRPRPGGGGDRDARARRGATTSRTCRSRPAGERCFDEQARAGDPLDAGRRRGGARAQEHGRARRQGGVRVGRASERRSSATAWPTAAGSAPPSSGRASGRRHRAQHRPDRRRRRGRAGHARDRRRDRRTSASSGSRRTSRRTARCCSSR